MYTHVTFKNRGYKNENETFQCSGINNRQYDSIFVLREISVAGKCYDKIMADNIEYSQRFGFKMTKKEKNLESVYSIPKIHENRTGA